MFFPYRTSLKAKTYPLVTVLFALLCIFTFVQQQRSHDLIETYVSAYCSDHEPRALLTLIAVSSQHLGCITLFTYIHSSYRPENRISAIVNASNPINGLSFSESRRFLRQRIDNTYGEFVTSAPENLSGALAFYPDKPLGPSVISANFAHAGWLHLIGNLAFFLVFGAAVEKTVGHFTTWWLVLLFAAGSQITYGYLTRQSGAALPSIGLSGAIMGLIAFITVLRPRMRVHFMTFLLAVWRPALPVWVLASGFVGWDLLQQLFGNTQDVNYVAHLGGVALGTLAALAYRKLRAC